MNQPFFSGQLNDFRNSFTREMTCKQNEKLTLRLIKHRLWSLIIIITQIQKGLGSYHKECLISLPHHLNLPHPPSIDNNFRHCVNWERSCHHLSTIRSPVAEMTRKICIKINLASCYPDVWMLNTVPVWQGCAEGHTVSPDPIWPLDLARSQWSLGLDWLGFPAELPHVLNSAGQCSRLVHWRKINNQWDRQKNHNVSSNRTVWNNRWIYLIKLCDL